ncbi:flagellar basal body L-ring protein FlgH [Paludibacterium paludis]|uniref:Flagellar L-ring protein n=1 Tax=Paludibacterium paludis TaxID=1225769 RepID=A0A918NY74_9NEIS|nr:flagellar basal body L-ring protein FlgH [Paludibacterium paludis]GGY04812.1 flagellar L-ring protein 2 [Paludibacterium paludis]
MKRLAALGLVLLAGCSVVPPMPPAVDNALPDIESGKLRGTGGGVFRPSQGLNLVADRRATRAGDVLTVVLQESTQATKQANTRFDKNSGITAKPAVILGGAAMATEMGVDAKRNFAGNSSSTQQNALSGSITVVVHKVLPNGLLMIKGQKKLNLNQDDEFITLSGYVREEDIGTDNRISSQRIANATISYTGKGSLADANSAGWLTRLFNSPWMPF